ncbi:MAG: sigma-70 family RNA polymerase sigma factor [Xenococcaceae cyanobacterium]
MTIQKSIDDISLIRRIAQQDQAALSELYDLYARVMYSVTFKMLGSVEEAEEVVLDVFSQVWRTAITYNPKRGRVDSWLFMLTRSRALDRLRSTRRQSKAVNVSKEAAQVQSSSSGATPQENLLIQERRERVMAALAQIPEEQRLVIELAYYQGMTQTEIAAQTGVSLGTVKTRIRLGLSKLRRILDDRTI